LSYILYVNISFFCALCSGLYMTLWDNVFFSISWWSQGGKHP
jgi:hypothetical protein